MDDGIWNRLVTYAERTPTARYLLCGDCDWMTYQELRDRAERVAAGLRRLGLGKGDRIAYLVPTVPEAVILFYACARMGAISAPLNTFLRGEFLRYQLADLQASAIVVDVTGARQLSSVGSELPDLRQLILIGASQLPEGEQAPGGLPVTPFEELEAETAPVDAAVPVPTDICAILYTGGTTGMPKGCLIPHSYVSAIAATMTEMGLAKPGDTVLTVFPFFHMGGIYTMCIPLWVGAAAVWEAEFHASTMIARARETGATVIYGMGAVAMALLAQPASDKDRDHSIRLGFLMPLTAEVQATFTARFGMHVLSELYGQTECVPVSNSRVDGDRRPGSAGREQPNIEMLIVDGDDLEVPVGEVGEIVVRPRKPGVMFAGYWNHPEATMEAWRNLWHHTGDFGRLDADGYVHFVDRKKDALRRRGEFVSSFELEQAILTHPDVAAVAVHAVPSEMTEDDIKACIALAPGKEATPQALFEFFRGNLPYFAIPRYVELFDELPATAATRRVQKAELRQRGTSGNTWDFEALGLVVPRDERRGVAT